MFVIVNSHPPTSWTAALRRGLRAVGPPLGRALLAAGLLLGLARCDWTASAPEEDAVVVEAFLETGAPLPSITLRQTAPLSVTKGGVQDAASGAEVVLVHDGRRVVYRERSGAPGHYDPLFQDTVAAQVPWALTVEWEGATARAQGQTPRPISITEVCVDVPSAPVQAIRVDSLRRDSLDIPATLDYIYPIDVRVRWPSTPDIAIGDTAAWVRAQVRPDASPFPSEVVEFFLEPAAIQREQAYVRTDSGRRWQGVYAVPVDSSDDDLLPTHDVTAALVRGDTAFAEFAQSRTDPDRREPISNVEGGLGIATAVSVDSVVVEGVTTPGTARCVSP